MSYSPNMERNKETEIEKPSSPLKDELNPLADTRDENNAPSNPQKCEVNETVEPSTSGKQTDETCEAEDVTDGATYFCHFCSKLPPDRATVLCESCCFFYCESCAKELHPNRGKYADHLLLNIENNPPDKYVCSSHNRRLELICTHCCLHCCTECANFGRHKFHNVIKLQDAAVEMKEKAELGFDQVQHALEPLADFPSKILVEKGKIIMKKNAACEKVNGHFASLYHVLERFEKSLLLQIDEEADMAEDKLDQMLEKYFKATEEVKDMDESLVNIGKERNSKHILTEGTAMLKRADEVLGTLKELDKMQQFTPEGCVAEDLQLPPIDKPTADRGILQPINKEISSLFQAPEPVRLRQETFVISDFELHFKRLFPCSYFILPPREENLSLMQRTTYFRAEVANDDNSEVYTEVPFSKELTINDTLFVCGNKQLFVLGRKETTGLGAKEVDKSQTESGQGSTRQLGSGQSDNDQSVTGQEGTCSPQNERQISSQQRMKPHKSSQLKHGGQADDHREKGKNALKQQKTEISQRGKGPVKNDQAREEQQDSGQEIKVQPGPLRDPACGQLRPGSTYRVKVTPYYQGSKSGVRVFGSTATFTIKTGNELHVPL
ncbi:uncharacterized protein LOC106163488 [Lingula anatina]|uniref:Uncharacterized protein LOC106163488 n=1 Tax=Lingula anatina TaxID=7574 RepID=A0A1S3IFB5_LINAN|nr:uncharacterized protein LOC106163488 [Lingula anatina]|eukprot:XP_013396546.1 uncharacterized protein LOC106163488 [Lingula anatina]